MHFKAIKVIRRKNAIWKKVEPSQQKWIFGLLRFALRIIAKIVPMGHLCQCVALHYWISWALYYWNSESRLLKLLQPSRTSGTTGAPFSFSWRTKMTLFTLHICDICSAYMSVALPNIYVKMPILYHESNL